MCRFTIAFLTLALVFSFIGGTMTADTVLADDSEKKVIRIGFPTMGGLSFMDEYGNPTGYTYEYLQEIAQYTGWEYEFVEIEGNQNDALMSLLTMLENGEIDILGGMSKNAATQEMFDFPEYSYGYSYRLFCALEENANLSENNFMQVKKLRIAVHENAKKTNTEIETFCKLSNISYELVPCNGDTEVFEALQAGRADVMVNSDLSPVPGTRIVAKFSGAPYYFATTKGNHEILNELNRTILTIDQVKPLFETELYEKYFSQKTSGVFFSQAELSYIRQAQPLKIAVPTGLAPLQQYTSEKGFSGIIISLLDIIQEATGLQFEYLPTDSLADALAMLQRGEADAVSGIPRDYSLAQKNNLIMSAEMFSSQMVLVAQKGQGDNFSGKIVGIIEGGSDPQYENYSHTVTYKNYTQCLDDILDKKIDFAYMNLYSSQYFSHYTKYRELRVVPQSEKTFNCSLGISKKSDTVLVSIINKVISSIPDDRLETIIYQATVNTDEKITFFLFLEQNPQIIVWLSIIVFLLLCAVGFAIFKRKIAQSRALDIENQRYLLLCELANEYIYEYNVKSDTLLLSKSFSDKFDFPTKLENCMATALGKVKPGPEYTPEVFDSLTNPSTRNGIENHTDYHRRLPNGEYRWFKNTMVEIKDSDEEIIYVLGKLTDIQAEREEKERLEHSALTDGLTGFYNNVAFKKLVNNRLDTMSQKVALIIIDIDHFKNVNDRLGHYVGDKVLKEFAASIKGCITPEDIAGRLGGDEFVIYISSAEGCEKISSICKAICEKARRQYTNEDGDSYNVTVSVGAALLNEKTDFSSLYQLADKQLYISKEKGRDRYTVADCE